MTAIHIRDIEKLLAGSCGSRPSQDGYFLEIRFDEPTTSDGVADDAMRNKVITAESPQGTVTLVFDDAGLLKSLDIS